MTFIELDSCLSTNSYVKEHRLSLPDLAFVSAREQTAGRGQRGNKWEAEPGKNLTFSLLHRPVAYPAREQFQLSESVALAIADALGAFGMTAMVKWTNDIYIGEKKICGILIENSVCGSDISDSVIGVGLNVNQERFLSDAPNPVSMRQLAGREFELEEVRAEVAHRLEERLRALSSPENRLPLHEEYKSRLWRHDGRLHPFRDTATGEIFDARIAEIDADGTLHLQLPSGTHRDYRFKEIAFLPH